MFEAYHAQVSLLIKVLPLVAQEKCFALHGGTAINLFVQNMPRLSVDIDLTYLPIEDRPTTLSKINEALTRIQSLIEKTIQRARVIHKDVTGKLLISSQGANIKLEVNLVARGTLSDPVKMKLCDKAQSEFEAFVVMPVIPFGQLYGGKICAALDRQHPRDLFDVKLLLEKEGFSDEVRRGFLLCLLASDRPIHELLSPNFQDQRQIMKKQFTGMTDVAFSYDEFEQTRSELIKLIQTKLTEKDRAFLLSLKEINPDWHLYDFERFPTIQWKLKNLQKLKSLNPDKHRTQFEALKTSLYS